MAGVTPKRSLLARRAWQSPQFGVIQAMAPSLRVEVSPIDVRDAGEIERAITAFAHPANGGLIATSSAATALHRAVILGLAARHKLPTVYYERFFVAAGALISYGPDYVDQYRQAAHYADRILKGEKPADLPVQAPDKYELVINLKAAKALGLECLRLCSPPPTRCSSDAVAPGRHRNGTSASNTGCSGRSSVILPT